MALTPTYHVFWMFRPFQDATSLPLDLKTPPYRYGAHSVPTVSASAARTADGAIVVALVNLDPDHATPVSAQIEGGAPGQVSGSILTAPAMDAQNTFDTPDAVRPQPFSGATIEGGKLSATLPAKSVVVLELK
jgi:alpha-N-arabinofuranosidase